MHTSPDAEISLLCDPISEYRLGAISVWVSVRKEGVNGSIESGSAEACECVSLRRLRFKSGYLEVV